MKKFFIFISLFFSILFVDNIYAQTPDYSIDTSVLSQIYKPDIESHIYFNSTRKTATDNVINTIKDNYNYIAFVSDRCINIYYSEMDLDLKLDLFIVKGSNSYGVNNSLISLNYNSEHSSNISLIYQKQMCGVNKYIFSDLPKVSSWSEIIGEYNLNTNLLDTSSYENVFIYSNNYNFNFVSNNNIFSTNYWQQINYLQLCNSNNCYDSLLSSGDLIINEPFIFINDSSPNLIETNRVIKYNDDFYGFFNNYLVINNIFDDGSNVLGSAINCVENEEDLNSISNSRLFSNGYCLFNKTDKSDDINDVQFLDTYFAFSNLIGDSTVNYLHNNNYYLYSFRILKPFTPNISHLVLDTTNGSFNVPILNVYKYDGGSYVDYVVKFLLEFDSFENLDPTVSLKAITLIFNDKVSNYYGSFNDFSGFSVFRSFKLQWFSSNPTTSQLSEFYSNEDLSKIDGVERTNNFFTDTTFNTFGFSGIITAPFRLLYALESYNSCSPISLPFPHSNKSITLACVSDSIPNSINPLIIVLQTILSGIICYYIGVNTFAIIKEILTPDKDTVEVVDL